MDNSPRKLESTDIQQESSPSPHSFVSKKKERTPEEGKKAIYRTALIAAISSTRARGSTPNTPRTLPSVSSPVKTEAPSPAPSPASLNRTITNINCSPIEPENQSEDNGSFQEEQWSPLQVFEDTEAEDDDSEIKTHERVSKQTSRNLSFLVVLFSCIQYIRVSAGS